MKTIDFRTWLQKRLARAGEKLGRSITQQIQADPATHHPAILDLLTEHVHAGIPAERQGVEHGCLAHPLIVLVGDLQLVAAIPHLVQVASEVEGHEPILVDILTILTSFAEAALEPCAAAYAASPDVAIQDRFVQVLASLGIRHPRIATIIRRHLEMAPDTAITDAAVYGDPELIEPVRAALTSLPLGEDPTWATLDELQNIFLAYEALSELGAELTAEESARWDELIERHDRLLDRLDGVAPPKDEPDAEALPPVPAPERLQHHVGRNDPCWCGSGKKYKKCHLAADPAGEGTATA